jgi:hypothetical protein
LKLILQKYVLIDPDFFLSSGRFTEGMLFWNRIHTMAKQFFYDGEMFFLHGMEAD